MQKYKPLKYKSNNYRWSAIILLITLKSREEGNVLKKINKGQTKNCIFYVFVCPEVMYLCVCKYLCIQKFYVVVCPEGKSLFLSFYSEKNKTQRIKDMFVSSPRPLREEPKHPLNPSQCSALWWRDMELKTRNRRALL